MIVAVNPLWAGWPYLAAALLIAAWFAFRCIYRGATQVRANRQITRHSVALKGITREDCR